MNSQTPYLILGTGPLGLAIMDELVAQGHSAKLINRRGTLNEPLPAGVTIQAADVTNPDTVASLSQSAEFVFWCTQPAYHRWPEEFPQMTAAVIEGVSRTDAKLIFGSNTYMYGDPAGKALVETTPVNPHTRKGAVRAQMADMLLEAHRSGRLSVVIGRASDFYGPRVYGSAMGNLVFEAALDGKAANLSGDIDQPHSYTYIHDFARALVTLAHCDDSYGQVWHVPNAPATSTREFIQLIEKELGEPIKIRNAGPFILRLVGLFNPAAKEMIEMLYEFDRPYVVDSSKYMGKFNQAPTPFSNGIRETVAWYRNQAT